METLKISRQEALDFLLPKHYSGRSPSVSEAFGYFDNGVLVAVCTFGKPASNTLCDGVLGKAYSKSVFELNRVCRIDSFPGQLSQFISKCLKEIARKDWVIVSYSDTGMSHTGYLYQACNFMYTGCTKERLEFHVPGSHSRHGRQDSGFRQIRTAKHRYLYFCTKKKWLRKEWQEHLQYPILPYPKGDNKTYTLGDFLKPTVIAYQKPNLYPELE